MGASVIFFGGVHITFFKYINFSKKKLVEHSATEFTPQCAPLSLTEKYIHDEKCIYTFNRSIYYTMSVHNMYRTHTRIFSNFRKETKFLTIYFIFFSTILQRQGSETFLLL